MIICTTLLTIQHLLGHIYGEHHSSMNDYWTCKQLIWDVICSLLSMINALAAFIGKAESDTVTALFWQ